VKGNLVEDEVPKPKTVVGIATEVVIGLTSVLCLLKEEEDDEVVHTPRAL